MLVLALLIAQVGAEVHAYSHLNSGADQAGAPGARIQFCADCLSFAPMLATAHSRDGQSVLRLSVGAPVAMPQLVSLVDRRPYHAFRSRAPPHPR
jgi:hypothetical protein